LPSRYDFDCKFIKKPSIVKAKFKNIIALTDEIDLVLKHDVANPQKTFIPHTDNEGKQYIAILSPEGFEYAKRTQNLS